MFPFAFLILINEIVRPTINETGYSKYGISVINPIAKNTDKCTWICHNNTSYCKEHHVKILKPYFSLTDLFYFGVIGLLAMTGNYGAANV